MHMMISDAAYNAIAIAADEDQYTDTTVAYGTWEVKKLYRHLWKEGQIKFDWNVPLNSMGGATGLELADSAFEIYHKTQETSGQSVLTTGLEYDNGLFGLVHTTVGEDVENILLRLIQAADFDIELAERGIIYIDEMDKMVRPANMYPLEYGKGYRIFEFNGKKIALVNLIGEVFMVNVSESPFKKMEEILSEIEADIVLVDLHAEATSEKIAFTYEFAKRCTVVVGTHTHVQTADERIVDDHCAAISDLGMCGPYHSVIGRDIDEILRRFKYQEQTRFTMAEGKGIFCGCIVEIDDETNQAITIKRIQIKEQ